MQPLPHTYEVGAQGRTAEAVVLSAEGVRNINTAPPREFDGPGDEWSPESLLVAAAASCFILTFRAVARAAKIDWTRLECKVTGTLERRDGIMLFTHLVTTARLTIPATTLAEACEKALRKAEQGCLVSNSLRATRELRTELVHEGARVVIAG